MIMYLIFNTMFSFVKNQLYFLKRSLIFLLTLAVAQSALALSIARVQSDFFATVGRTRLGWVLIMSYGLLFLSRGIMQWVRQTAIAYAAIAAEGRWLEHYAPRITGMGQAQRAQLLHADLPQWLNFLLEQGPALVQDIAQLVFFLPLLASCQSDCCSGFFWGFFVYVVAVNIGSAALQKQSLSWKRQEDRIGGYWHARLYRCSSLSSHALKRRQRSRWALFWARQWLWLFDIGQQTASLLLPMILLGPGLLSGHTGLEEYVLCSQVVYNLLPALTHIAAHRERWATGWAAGQRLCYSGSWGLSVAQEGVGSKALVAL